MTLSAQAPESYALEPDVEARVRELCARLHCSLASDQFIEAVAIAFQDVQAGGSPDEIRRRFMAERSYELFRQALSRAAQDIEHEPAILVLGCGRGFAGQSAEFAEAAVRETYQHKGATITPCGVTPETLRSGSGWPSGDRRFDLVVSYSIFHYVPVLGPLFSLIQRALNPGGCLVVAHEPNALFWQNEACRSAVAALQKSRRRSALRRGVSRFRQMFRKTTTEPFVTRVNQRLQQRLGFRGELSANEIARIVDIHRPEAAPGQFRIGREGFDFRLWEQAYLADFRRVWIATAGHLGYMPVGSLSQEWQDAEKKLAVQEPLSGSVFTALWARN